ncbi:MAG: hypothetical protein ACPGWR_17330 [Ardenticatenaceae bacterium]
MILPSGGRAGVYGHQWIKAGYNLDEIEQLRQELLSRNDYGPVQRALQKMGISVKRSIIQAVKRYNFDSSGIAYTYENYTAWRRLATSKGTIGDVAYVIHEIAEVKELERIQSETGFDFMGRAYKKLTKKRRAQWMHDFNRYYYPAHSIALEREYEFIAEEVNRYISDPNLKITRLQAAAIDPTRLLNLRTKETEAAKHMFVDGVIMKEHRHYDSWRGRANQFIPLSKAIQRRVGYYRDKITLKNLMALVKNRPIK